MVSHSKLFVPLAVVAIVDHQVEEHLDEFVALLLDVHLFSLGLFLLALCDHEVLYEVVGYSESALFYILLDEVALLFILLVYHLLYLLFVLLGLESLLDVDLVASLIQELAIPDEIEVYVF